MTERKPKPYALSDFTLAIELILRNPGFKAVTVFQSPLDDITQRVRVSRKFEFRRSGGDLVVTYGKPNYREREFLKQCKAAKCQPRKWKGW